MDKDINGFINALDRGIYWEEMRELTEEYHRHASRSVDAEHAALVGIEYAQRLSFFMLKKYDEWIRLNQ